MVPDGPNTKFPEVVAIVFVSTVTLSTVKAVAVLVTPIATFPSKRESPASTYKA